MKRHTTLFLAGLILISITSLFPVAASEESSQIEIVPLLAELIPHDLETAPASAPESPFFAGYCIDNTGNRPSGTFLTRLYLSSDTNLSGNDILVWEKKEGFLSVGDTGYFRYQENLPDSIRPGTWYPVLVSDAKNIVPERDETNNCIIGDPVLITKEFERPRDFYLKKIGDLIIFLTNEERDQFRMTQLKPDPGLMEIAQDHSNDMAERDYLSHINPDGENPSDRALRHGYTPRRVTDDGDTVQGIAENIIRVPIGNTRNYGYIDEDDIIAIAELILDSWMHSADHRENILNRHLEKIGVGVSFDEKRYYATQNMI
ncbi:MAG: hypothetical protein JXA44_03905 [Methanospirillaceae archaeon]|nr:hypothetical protein [Methanospirillaceae archaeon]